MPVVRGQHHARSARQTQEALTFEGPARFQYELDDEGKINTNADGTISVTWWLRDDNGEWKPWMNNTFTRVKDYDSIALLTR